MPMYRIHKNLAVGEKVIPRGSLTPLGLSSDKIDKLIEVGAISRVQSPPLAVLPGWSTRANRLEPLGILDVEQFLDADPAVIAKHLKVKPATVQQWREDMVEWITAKPASG